MEMKRRRQCGETEEKIKKTRGKVMNRTSCIVNIQSKMKVLTGSEKKVAEYVLKNYMRVLDFTVTELAEKAGVSDATVVRFCRSVGYKGYQDMKINLAQDAIVPYKHLNNSLEERDTPEQIVTKVLRSEIETLEETIHILDMDELEQAAKAIKNADKVVFFGSGGSIMVHCGGRCRCAGYGICAFEKRRCGHRYFPFRNQQRCSGLPAECQGQWGNDSRADYLRQITHAAAVRLRAHDFHEGNGFQV